MAQCLVRGVRSVELVATNFEEAGKFYESVWGLEPVAARNGAQLYRGTAGHAVPPAFPSACGPQTC